VSAVLDLDGVDRQIDAYWRAPRRLSLAAWADKYFRLPEGDANAGRWRTYPYQRDILDAIGDPSIERVTVMKSSQVGYSKMVLIALSYFIAEDPCRILVVQPAEDDAEKYSKEEIAPLFSDLPVLRRTMSPPKSRTSSNTILRKAFPGGSLSLVGANAPRGFRRVSRRVLVLEEPEEYPESSGKQGDPVLLALRRTEAFWNRKILAGSTPAIAGHSRIEDMFHEGDERYRYVPCPRCGEFQVLRFPNLKWPRQHPELAYFVCEANECQIEHRRYREMDEAGAWRAHHPERFTPFNRHTSWYLWAAYSYSPNATWGQIATEFVKATAGGPVKLQTFVNTVLGETWKDRGEAPEWERLYQRRESYAIGSAPTGVLFLTAGVDVQRTRLKYEVVGWGRGKASWSIEAGTLPGNTADLEKGPWSQLDALLNRTFRHAYGVELPIRLLAVDSGDNTSTVYAWARLKPLSRVIAIKGVEVGHALISPPTPVEVNHRGRKLKRGYRVWPVCGHVAKSELYGWLGLQPPTEPGALDPPGYCHFPEYGEWFFKELTAEQLVPTKTRRGYVIMQWTKMPNRDNDHLDARVYARAAAAVVGLDRFSESDWSALEAAVGKPANVEPEVYDDEILPEGAEVIEA
jgi:phage terminase large subunit GpA-like protein